MLVKILRNSVSANPFQIFLVNQAHYCKLWFRTKSSEGTASADIAKEARYKYHQEVEDAVNKQIIAEFNAAYSYLSLACYFGRTSVGLLGTQKFYMKMFNEENEHALKLIKYQEMRGAPIKLTSIEAIECGEDCSIQQSLQLALGMEKQVTDQLIQIIEVAKKHEDIRTEDFIVTEYIAEQMESIRDLGALLGLAIRMGESGIADHLLDMKLASSNVH